MAQQAAMTGQPLPPNEDGSPAEPPQPPEQPEIPPPPPQSREIFDQAVELLRSDRARGFSVAIETDSMVLEDQQQEAQNRTDLLEKATGFLAQAMPASEQFPAMGPLLGSLLLWAIRGHKTGRDIEQEVEQAWDGLMNQEPAGEDPAIAAQAEIEGQKVQVAQAKVQVDQAKAEADAQIKGAKVQADTAKAQAEAQLKAMQMQMDAAKAERDAALERERIVAEQASAKFEQLVKMMELRLGERELKAVESKNAVDAVISAAQVDAQADAARQAADAKRMQGAAE
jgi:hypothetical protein